MLILTIAIVNTGRRFDIMVKPEQRIKDVFEVLSESGKIDYDSEKECLYARTWRQGSYINLNHTFRQAFIQTKDIIFIEVRDNG